jgi:hypothetical protein
VSFEEKVPSEWLVGSCDMCGLQMATCLLFSAILPYQHMGIKELPVFSAL